MRRSGRGAGTDLVVLVTAVVVAVAACAGATSGGGPNGSRPGASSGGVAPANVARTELVVYAAASLKNSLAAAAAAYETSHAGATVTVSTDSSAALATKIEQGAPADVFLSADTANPQKLVDEGLATGRVVPFARNALAIVVPANGPANVDSPDDLARPGLRIIAAGDAVPISRYAAQLVAKLAALPAYPVDFASRYTENVVSKEDNVAAVLAKIELGEGDAAIVYATDAKGSSKVSTIAVPEAANVTATYGGVVVRDSPHLDAAAAFLAWVAGPDGQAVMATFGFRPPS